MKLLLHTDSPTSLSAGVLAVPVFEEALDQSEALSALDGALGGLLTRVAKEEEFTGTAEKTLLVHAGAGVEADRILLVGLGREADFSPPDARSVGVHATRTAQGCNAEVVGLVAPDVPEAARTLEALAEGLHLGAYRCEVHKSEAKPFPVEEVRVVLPPSTAEAAREAALAALERGARLGGCTNAARDLVNGPANDITPTHLADFARGLAKEHGLQVEVLDRAACEEHEMGLFLAVARGSEEPPAFIRLTWEPPAGTEVVRTVALIGKGVTFDSGGLSLKTPKHMEDMKTDMAGGAAVLAAMGAIAAARPPVRVHALCAATENMPSGAAYRPGDIVHGMGGRSVEVLNTDAEGRLTLADAITFALGLEVDEVVELSTLTGACVVGLGSYTAGLMTTDDALAERLLRTRARTSGACRSWSASPRTSRATGPTRRTSAASGAAPSAPACS